jgi:hypothetical protein
LNATMFISEFARLRRNFWSQTHRQKVQTLKITTRLAYESMHFKNMDQESAYCLLLVRYCWSAGFSK